MSDIVKINSFEQEMTYVLFSKLIEVECTQSICIIVENIYLLYSPLGIYLIVVDLELSGKKIR